MPLQVQPATVLPSCLVGVAPYSEPGLPARNEKVEPGKITIPGGAGLIGLCNGLQGAFLILPVGLISSQYGQHRKEFSPTKYSLPQAQQ